MSPKTKKAAPAKKEAKAAPEKKAGKAAKAKEVDHAADPVAPAVDADELEEAEDAAAAASSGGGGGGEAAALAAAGGATEMSASFKNFRHHPDMENFYRFIYENDLRHEALAIINKITIEKAERRAAKGGKGAH